MTAQIILKPADGYNVSVKTANADQVIGYRDAVSLIKNAAAAGYSIRVELRAYGYNLTSDVENAALAAAGLDGFAAAKQTALGFIEVN